MTDQKFKSVWVLEFRVAGLEIFEESFVKRSFAKCSFRMVVGSV